MPRMFLTQLIDSQPVYLTRTKERRGREAFLQAFPEAWQLLSTEVTDTIVRYWSEGETTSYNPYWPIIQLVPVIDKDQRVLGRCENGGYELYFVGPEVKKLPQGATYGLILHELAHVFCYATDHPSVYSWEEADSEIAARKLLKSWKLYDLQDELDREHPGPGAWLLPNKRRATTD